jgi:hypothetical protein
MNPSGIEDVIAKLRRSGFAHAEANIGTFAVRLAALIPQVLSSSFADQAQRAIDLVKRAGQAVNTPDLIGQIARDVDSKGVDIELVSGSNPVKVNLQPDLVDFARGKTSALTIGKIKLTETITFDLGDGIHVSASDTSVKATITITVTGTRNAATGEYDMTYGGTIDLDVNTALGSANG